MGLNAKAGHVVPYVLILGLLIAAAALLTISFLPYSYLKTQLAGSSLHGNATSFTPSLYARISVSVRLLSAIPVLLAGILYFFKRQVAGCASSLLLSFGILFSPLVGILAEAVKKESRVHLWAFSAILVTACAIRVAFLFQPMRYDEAYTFTHYASTPFYLALSNYSAPNNHLFHTLLVRVAYLLLGNHPWVLRLPALIAGILLVPASYVTARTFFDKYAALLAAGLVASSSALIEYSTNARGYTLLCLFSLLTLVLAAYLLRSPGPAAWVLFSLLSALGFYTIPTMLYPFGIVVLWLFLTTLMQKPPAERPRFLKDLTLAVVLAAILTLVLYSPVLLVWGPASIVDNRLVAPRVWGGLLQVLPPSAWSTWMKWNVSVPEAVGALLVAGFAVSLAFHRRVSPYRVPLAVVTVVWIVPVVLAQRVTPYERVWLFLLPLYFVLAAAGLAYLWAAFAPGPAHRKSILFALLAVGLSVGLSYNVARTQSVYWSEDTGTLRDAQAITLWMKDHLKPGDLVLAAVPSYGPLEYYFQLYNLPAADYWYPTQVANGRVGPGRRLWIVVKEPDQSLDSLLESLGPARLDYSSPVLVHRYQGASLYELTPKSSGA